MLSFSNQAGGFPPEGFESRRQNATTANHDRLATAAADPQLALHASSKPIKLGLKRPTTNTPTSHALLTVEELEPPRIPHSINCTPALSTLDHAEIRPFPGSQATREPRILSSFPSFDSLRSENSDSTPRKRRKHRLPFRRKFVGAWKEGLSGSNSTADAKHGSSTSRPAVDDVSEITRQLAGLPSDLKPAAAKRLGVQVGNNKIVGRTRSAIVIRTGPSSVIHSRAPSLQSKPPAASPTRTPSKNSRISAQVSASFPAAAQRRPEHPLEAEERLRSVGTRVSGREITAQQSTFFHETDSESEEDDKYSSGYSCNSSHTSYNVNTPTELDAKRLDGQHLDFAFPRNVMTRNDAATSSSHHQFKASTSSFGSYRTGGTMSPPSRPTSFSRPFSRLPPPHVINNSLSGSSTPKAPESEPHAHLVAIREDSPVPISDMSATRSSTQGVLKSSSASRKGDPSAAAQSYPHLPKHEQKRSIHSPKPLAREIQPVEDKKAVRFQIERRSPSTQNQSISAADKKSARPLSLAITKQSEALISADSAEAVILHIFETIDNFKDLFACARINKGFYKVFKRHELRLMKNALRNMSPAQWEHREASPKEIVAAFEGPKSDYTPTTYIQFHKRDSFVLVGLKSLLVSRCQAFLRYETVNALTERDTLRSARVDDALWRIWTFCTIFGSDKGREHDVNAQMDWLRGGIVTHRPTSPSSDTTIGDAKSSFSLAHTSESFGRGNYGGLTVEELYDMTELWNCIKALLQGILGLGRCTQAKGYGVFDGHALDDGDRKAEEALLEEWVYYLATLGPSTTFDLATHSNSSTDEVFAIAEDMGWASWSLPAHGKSRKSFLQEAITLVYEEKRSKVKQITVEQMQARRKSRGLELAAELRAEKRRTIDAKDPLVQHDDQSIKVWLEWIAKVEGRAPVPERSAAPSKPKVEEPAEGASSPRVPRSRSNSALSLFPSAYKRPTPKGTPVQTPMRSRNNSRSNSLLKSPEAAQELRQAALQAAYKTEGEAGDSRPQLFTPRLSICQET